MESPTKFLLILLGVVLFLAAFLVCQLSSPNTSFAIRLLVIISFGLGFAGIALLPVDLTITTVYDNDDAAGNDGTTTITPNATYGPWQVTYWSTFLLGFLVLPLIREAILSGHFTLRTRLQAGCKEALKGYVLLLLVGLVGVIFMAVKLNSWHVVPVLMALGNTYGLLLVSLLLGYGLVDLPQKLWRQANPVVELRRQQIIASNADEHLFEAVWNLQDIEGVIDNAATCIGDYEENGSRLLPMDGHYARCVDKLLTSRKTTAVLSPELQRRRTTGGHNRRHDDDDTTSSSHHHNDSDGYPTINYLAKLNARLQHAQNEVLSAEQRWLGVVKKSVFYAELVEGTYSRPVQATTGDDTSVSAKLAAFVSTVTSYCRYVWLLILRKPCFKVLGMSCAGLSGMVLWSEATLSFPYNVSPFALFLRLFDQKRGLLFQLAALIPFLYMSICVYSSLFKLSLFGPYKLRGRRMSAGIALVFNAQYLVRLQFPLGYNYLNMIKYDTSTTDCAFSHVMSNMATVPFFGTNFSVYAPLLILALCAFTLCHGYARVLAAFGIEHEDAILIGDQETLDSKVNEGITLLRRSSARVGSSPIPKQEMSDRKLTSFDRNGNDSSSSLSSANGIV
mmetsp:Transcript_30818/g.50907  ORF Transcript_30818/g.50907 Transcript_30818/m.50907 type:complete len:619 (+) Transcript_30818:250-2106(+)|eukprot:CAMPEP_0119005272 /NCGR_PEP_ID=MMETSP1176-20130426/1622_1 /TAXON_ID=265551 /ORGANISM="Synedropsis recta cf, Strain CCMP1620" /LENGTH=618 /DNA_ID=CAMNT_0006957061 /DNA_START=249 /DNA_END=2105 /DNA_ORIENTATION=-